MRRHAGLERVLAEQEAGFPHSPLGLLRPPEIPIESACRAEIKLLQEWKARRLGTMELPSCFEALPRKAAGTSAVADCVVPAWVPAPA